MGFAAFAFDHFVKLSRLIRCHAARAPEKPKALKGRQPLRLAAFQVMDYSARLRTGSPMLCNTARASADIPPLKFCPEGPKSPSSPSGSYAISGVSSAGSRCSACGLRGTPAVCPHTVSESIVARYAMHQAGVVHADMSCRRSRSKRQMPRPPESTAYAQASVSIEPHSSTVSQ